jgi:hypothetical protein
MLMISKRTQQILSKRQMVAAMDPLEVKSLALTYKLTPAQVRALLMAYGRDWLKFDRAATQLRQR